VRRRHFLLTIGHGAVLLPLVGLVTVSCKDDEAPPEPVTAGRTAVWTSSAADGHTHTLSMEVSKILTPPEGGAIPETSVDHGHGHMVHLEKDDLDALRDGKTVTKQTAPARGHTHTFELTMPG
jgi:hypothetical protein